MKNFNKICIVIYILLILSCFESQAKLKDFLLVNTEKEFWHNNLADFSYSVLSKEKFNFFDQEIKNLNIYTNQALILKVNKNSNTILEGTYFAWDDSSNKVHFLILVLKPIVNTSTVLNNENIIQFDRKEVDFGSKNIVEYGVIDKSDFFLIDMVDSLKNKKKTCIFFS